MTAIQVTLDLDEIAQGYARSYNDDEPQPQTLMEVILAQAANAVLDKVGREEVVNAVRERARAIRDEEIRARVVPLVQDAITQAIQPTDTYGQPKGAPTTMAEVITREATAYLTTKHRLNGNYNGPEVTAVQEFIKGEVDRAIKGELKAAMDQARAEVAAAIRAEGASIIQETISRMAIR